MRGHFIAISLGCLAIGSQAHAGGRPESVRKYQVDQVVVIKARPVAKRAAPLPPIISRAAPIQPVRAPAPVVTQGSDIAAAHATMLTTGSIAPPVSGTQAQPEAAPLTRPKPEILTPETLTRESPRQTVPPVPTVANERARRIARQAERRKRRRVRAAKRRRQSKDWMKSVLGQ